MTKGRPAVIVLLVLAVAAASCTRPEGETEIGRANVPTGGDSTSSGAWNGGALAGGGFGDIETVCGDTDTDTDTDTAAGAASGETGLTDDEIRLGTITDKGAAQRPGLTKEMYDTAVAFAAWCNEHGGIQGREVVIDDLDARLFDYGRRVAGACEEDFALVGGGGVFDSQGVEDRVDCGLPNFPGYTVTPQARVADLQVQAIPNPVYEFQAAGYRWLRTADDSAERFGVLWVNLAGPATIHDQVVETVEQLGYEVVFDEQYMPDGETGWRGLVQQMRDADVETFEMVGEPETMVALQEAMRTEGWYPDYTVLQPNFHDEGYLVEGAVSVSDTTYMRSPVPPFDMRDEVPALDDFLELMERYNPDGRVAFLGVQALSALLLFATAADACGARLSRACVLEEAGNVEGWTAGGLHAPQTPGNAEASECSLMLQVTPDGFVHDEELTQPTDGLYGCDADNVLRLHADYGVAEPES